MKQSIIFLSCLLFGLLSCTQSRTSESGLTTLNMASLDTLTTFLRNHGGLSSDESLEHYNITVTPKDANSQCTPKQTSSDQQSQSGATTTVSPGNFTLQTGDNDSCVYTLSAKYTSNKNSVFNGTTTIGKNQENPYTEGKTIDVKVTLKKDGAGTQISTAIGTSTTTGTKKDVNMTICYDGNCDNNTSSGSTTTTTTTTTPHIPNGYTLVGRKMIGSESVYILKKSGASGTCTTSCDCREAEKSDGVAPDCAGFYDDYFKYACCTNK